MIDRYTTPAMSAIWSREAKYTCWKDVEVAICGAWARTGLIPDAEISEIRSKAAFDLARCDEIELETRHDLAAFVRNLEETIGPPGRWIHFGVTSYDVIDTALGMMLRNSCDVLLESATKLRAEMERLAKEHKNTPMIGRTHAIHAEPITFGFKVASWIRSWIGTSSACARPARMWLTARSAEPSGSMLMSIRRWKRKSVPSLV